MQEIELNIVSFFRSIRVWLKRETGQYWPSVCHFLLCKFKLTGCIFTICIALQCHLIPIAAITQSFENELAWWRIEPKILQHSAAFFTAFWPRRCSENPWFSDLKILFCFLFSQNFGKKNWKSMGWSLLKIVWQRRCSILFSMLVFMPVVPAILTRNDRSILSWMKSRFWNCVSLACW